MPAPHVVVQTGHLTDGGDGGGGDGLGDTGGGKEGGEGGGGQANGVGSRWHVPPMSWHIWIKPLEPETVPYHLPHGAIEP